MSERSIETPYVWQPGDYPKDTSITCPICGCDEAQELVRRERESGKLELDYYCPNDDLRYRVADLNTPLPSILTQIKKRVGRLMISLYQPKAKEDVRE